jgi:SAM-dependent methyltransferase
MASPQEKVEFLINSASILPTLATALETGIFEVFDKPCSFDEFMTLLNIPERGAEVLLQNLVGANMVSQDPSSGLLSLVRPDVRPLYPQIMSWKLVFERQFFYLTESIEKDEPIGLRETVGKDVHDLYRARSHNATTMSNAWDEMMNQVNIHFERDLEPLFHTVGKQFEVLDVCGNAGSNAIRVAKQYTDARVTMTDLPGQCDKAEVNFARAGLATRIDTLPRDMLMPPLHFGSNAFDVVYMVHAVSIFNYETLGQIFRAVFTALRTGGHFMFDTVTGLARGQFRSNYINSLPVYFVASATSTHRIKFYPQLVELLQAIGFDSIQLYAAGKPVKPTQETFEMYDSFVDRQLYIMAAKPSHI